MSRKGKYVSFIPDWVLAGSVAGVVWGGWAYLANLNYSASASLKAMFAQGIISFVMASVLTLLASKVLSWIRLESKSVRQGVSVLIPVCCLVCIQYGIHYMSHTPNIIATISLPVSAGAIWCFLYTRRLINQ